MKKLKLPLRQSVPETPESVLPPLPADTDTRPAGKRRGFSRRKLSRPKAKFPRITPAFALMKQSLRDYRNDWKRYVKILAVVTIPLNLLSLLAFFNADPRTESYIALTQIIMNIALLWAIVRRRQTGAMPGVAEAYYDSSVVLVRYVLVVIGLVAMLVPAAFGAALYAIGLVAADVTGIFGPEQILLGLVALILALPSFYFLVRYSLAPFITVRDGLRPIASLSRSRRVTVGYFWPVAGRLAMLILFLAILSLPATLLAFGMSLIKLSNPGVILFQILSTFTALPIMYLYFYRLYDALEAGKAKAAATTTAPEPAFADA